MFLVGHVTKEGQLAGPRVLEHMVDTVLYFEGDPGDRYRILRAIKNRFGAVNELTAVHRLSQVLDKSKRLANCIYPAPAGVAMMSSLSIDIPRTQHEFKLIQKRSQPPALV